MKTIVYASGGFDPLHVGHIEYLEKARQLGDCLIVSVTRDEQLIKKKGHVFMPEEERIKIIRSLKCVDIAIFSIDEDETVIKTTQLLRNLHMDKRFIFAKGGDRNRDNIPEREICEKLGIEIVDGLGDKIQSSSWLLEKVGR